ncbi:MAG TPA: L-threonylcarbamoyladenylate synthase [Bryobacteraceae bacterium]|nr:L-threonylcarbamoyladenylate synthase [Bryobacteraceae bacterium]
MASAGEIRHAADLIRKGRLVAFPTETVYGLGANALDPVAVRRIFQAKGRPASSPLIVHVSTMQMARTVAAEWPVSALTLASNFWPGPLTLILPKTTAVPSEVTAGLPSVGVRIPRHPVALALIEAAEVPIAAPSANPFSRVSPTAAEHVQLGLGDRVDYVLQGGSSEVGIESTVVSLTGPPTLLRPGAISAAEIESLIGPLETASTADVPAHASPGLHKRHYQPRTPLLISDAAPAGRGVRIWWDRPGKTENGVQLPADAAGYAAALYRALHELDSGEWDFIQVEPVPQTPEWAAVRDRLMRAAGSGEAEDRVI